VPSPARWSHACVRLDLTTASKYSIGRSGRTDGLLQARLAAPSCRRIDASLMNARALRLRFSKSLASLRQRLSHARVRSTTQRLGNTSKPFAVSERLTISTDNRGRILANSLRNCGPC